MSRAGRAEAGLTMRGLRRRADRPARHRRRPRSVCRAGARATPRSTSAGWAVARQNFYNQLAVRMGFADAAATGAGPVPGPQDRDAAAAVPFGFVDTTSLIGPIERIRDRLQAYADAGTTTLSVTAPQGALDQRIAGLRSLVDALDAAGLADGMA